jgi:hypothetical protein
MEAGQFNGAMHRVQMYEIETGECMDELTKKITRREQKVKRHGETGRKRK